MSSSSSSTTLEAYQPTEAESHTPAEAPAANSEWASQPLPPPLQAKLAQVQELSQTARDLALAIEAARRPRWVEPATPGGKPELETTRPFTHRVVRRKTVNDRELAFAREEARLLFRELDQAARDEICADGRLRDRIGDLIAADAAEMADWQDVTSRGWIRSWR